MSLNLDRIQLICPCCSQGSPSPWSLEDPPDNSGNPFYVTKDELAEAGGWILCEYCETKCVEVKNE